ncbi:hypothetical protein [Aureivirga sp. CE67]|uniref:hypothetical protein n=1 Tax=Aureivirga sp. CE67 TaxID=1788983 RepID=UPI0018C91C4A|nr:hypothetical protein [Aureivirga sp. CE67]
MGWVKDALKELSKNGSCQIRPQGGSMRGRIESGQLVTIEKIKPEEIKIEDAALVKWKGNYLLHIIKEINENEVLIGNNLGKINGWIPIRDVIGKVVKVED